MYNFKKTFSGFWKGFYKTVHRQTAFHWHTKKFAGRESLYINLNGEVLFQQCKFDDEK